METHDAVYFYGHKNDFGWMSNFYSCTFEENNIVFNCSEQYFMYHKCKLFDSGNESLLKSILDETKPSTIKKFGRMVQNYNDTIWNDRRYDIMKQGVKLKFLQDEELYNALLTTENKMIYEAAPTDRIWGIGVSIKKINQISPNQYGQNLLGKVLMQVREELRTT